jgi:hypothetical protein
MGSSTGSLLLPASLDQADCAEENRQEPKRSYYQADEQVVPQLTSDVARQIANGTVIQIEDSPADRQKPTQNDECIGAWRLPASVHGRPRGAGCIMRKATSSTLLTAEPGSCVPTARRGGTPLPSWSSPGLGQATAELCRSAILDWPPDCHARARTRTLEARAEDITGQGL